MSRSAAARAIPLAAILLGTLVLGGIAGTGVLGGGAPAQAHATVVDTDPLDGTVLKTSPRRLQVVFNESVRRSAGAARLYDAKAKPVPVTTSGADTRLTVGVPRRLPAGTYVLVWQVVSADGHPISGSLTFSVARPSPTVLDPPTTGVRVEQQSALVEIHHGLAYAALLLTVGLLVFRVFLLPEHPITADVVRRLDRMVLTAAAVAAMLSATLAALGAGSWWSCALVVVGLGAAIGVRHRLRFVGALLALSSEAIVGHTRAAEPLAGVILVDVTHLTAGAVWFGGLVGLIVSLPTLVRREPLAAETLARFSTWAAATLAALLAAGAMLSWRILQTWDNFWHSPFGVLLLVKIALVLVAVAIAAVNRFVLVPRVRASVGHAEQRDATSTVRRAVTAEALVIVAVLLVTGFLVDRPPQVNQEVAAGATSTRTALIGDYRVYATLAPSGVGVNRLRVQVQDLGGEPVEPKTWPTVSVSSAGVDLGERTMTNDDAGTRTTTVILPEPGRWRVRVGLRIDEFTNPVVTLPFDVTP